MPADHAGARPRRIRRCRDGHEAARRRPRRTGDVHRTGRRRRDHQPAREHAGVGSHHGRTGGTRPRLAGPPHRRRVHHGETRTRLGDRSEPVVDQGRLDPRQHAGPRGSRPVRRNDRQLDRVDAQRRCAARQRPDERLGDHQRSARRRRLDVGPRAVRCLRRARVDTADRGRLGRRDRPRDGTRRCAADRGACSATNRRH